MNCTITFKEDIMKKILSVSLAILMSIASAANALDISDSAEIHLIIDHFSYVWNYQDGHGIADNYAQDADFVSHIGIVVTGKNEIETAHQTLQTFLQGSRFEVADVRLREVPNGVVIAHVFWNVSNIQGQGRAFFNENAKGIFTHVFLKNDGKWEIIASHNTINVPKH